MSTLAQTSIEPFVSLALFRDMREERPSARTTVEPRAERLDRVAHGVRASDATASRANPVDRFDEDPERWDGLS